MINFETLFKNFFDTDKISDDNLKKFTEDHIQRLIANNGGGTFTSILTATTTKFNAYFGKIAAEDISFAVQQSLTKTVDQIMADFKNSVSQQEGLIRSFYNVNTSTYQEFFPLGVTEYRQAGKSNIETLMARMVSACTVHTADLGAAIVTLFTDYKTNYKAARDAQLLKFGEVDTNKTGTETARNDLEVQLCANLHFIGFTFPADVSRCMDFFDQSIVRADVSSATDGKGRVKGIVKAAGTGLPVFDAAIELIGTNVPITHSKPDGAYKTQFADTGNFKMRVTANGFPEKIVEVTIEDDGDTNFDVDL